MHANQSVYNAPPPPPASASPVRPGTAPILDGGATSSGRLGSTFGITLRREKTDRMRWLSTLTILGTIVGVGCAALGRIPFDLPMPTHAIGMVTPTCGLTRGTVAIMRGHFALALRYNPASFAVPLIAVAALARLGWGVVGSRRWLNITFRPTRTSWILGTMAFVGWWAYQQSNAMFIMHSHVV